MIEENVKNLLTRLPQENAFGEKITLVAATKTRTPEEINRAIQAGITDIGENKVQEFRDKFDFVQGARRHFIGHLQTNKVKYLIGKTFLIHSVDRDELANEISVRSERAGVLSNILIQINIGCEESKGGYPIEEGFAVFERLSKMPALKVKGFMAMLPAEGSTDYLGSLCDAMRKLFERARQADPDVEFLSMGMSGDYELCLSRGANMIRLGTAIFGERNYL